ncbi:MAG: ppiB [Ignavibacteria bacterium]|nr:ppiB [Ignavibacteria bacterium]
MKYKTSLIVSMILFMFLTLDCTSQQNKNQTQKEGKQVEHPQYVISLTQAGKPLGDIVIELFPETAPLHCKNFDSLVSVKFYDGTAFHRVIPGFMIQGGDPNSKSKPRETWGVGEPGQKTVKAEFSDISHKRGILSTARKGNDINSATSQFFIIVADSPFLDKQYTVFGQVVTGMEIADIIVSSERDGRDNPKEKIEMQVKKK